MNIKKLDDYQSWLFSAGSTHVAVDPWLTGRYNVRAGAWLLGRERESQSFTAVEDLPELSAVVLTSAFADHLHLSSLELLERKTPIFAAKAAAKKIAKLGFDAVTVLRPHASHRVGELVIRGVRPGFPFSFSAVGVLVEAGPKRAYLETHVVSSRNVRGLTVDALIAPRQAVSLLGLPLAMPAMQALSIARSLNARHYLPTGLDPELNGGFLNRLLAIGDKGGEASILRTLRKGEWLEL